MLAFIKGVFKTILEYTSDYNDYRLKQYEKIGYYQGWY